MRPTVVWAAALAVGSPVLLLPEVWPRVWQAGGLVCAIIAMGAAVPRMRLDRSLPLLLLLGLVGTGWLRASPDGDGVSHLANVVLGVALAAGVAALPSGRAVRVATGVLMAIGLAMLVAGLVGAAPPADKGLPWLAVVQWLPSQQLALPGLDETGTINRNAIGGLAVLILPVAIGAALSAVRAPRSATLLAVATTVAVVAGQALLASQSRSSIVAALVMAGGAGALLTRTRRGLVLLLILTTAALAGVASWARDHGAPDVARMVRSAEHSLADRQSMFTQGVDRFRESPWLGIGLNEFRRVYVPPTHWPESRTPHAHNMLLQTALDVGLLGLLVYLLVFGLGARAAWRGWRAGGALAPLSAGAGLAIIGVHVFGLADAIVLGARVGLLQWGALGLALAAEALTPVPPRAKVPAS